MKLFLIATFLLFAYQHSLISGAAVKSAGDISKQKCKEYSKHAGSCEHFQSKLGSRVQKAKEKEFPHVALIGYESEPNKITFGCDASIISDQFVLTAAHCIKNPSQNPKYVKVGVSNLRDDTITYEDSNIQMIKIASTIVHPKYTNSAFFNDIALVKLEKKINFSDRVHPICLNSLEEIKDDQLILSGFGSPRAQTRDDLKKMLMKFVDKDECDKAYDGISHRKLSGGIDYSSQICVKSSSEDEALSMSGDALQIHHKGDDAKCMYDLVGFASFGKGFQSNTPEIHTKISYYLDWIEKNVWEDEK